MLIDQTSKVSVHTLISGDELIGEGKSWHKTSLFQPENGTETARKEDSFNTGEGDDSLGEGSLRADPSQGPFSFLSNRWDVLDGFEKVFLLDVVLNVSVDQKSIGLRMNILHHHLETVESSSLWDLDLCHESLSKVLKNNTITGSEESKNVLDEMFLVISEVSPIFKISTKIDLFSSPEASLLILVTLPDIIILDWKDDKPVRVILKKWL